MEGSRGNRGGGKGFPRIINETTLVAVNSVLQILWRDLEGLMK